MDESTADAEVPLTGLLDARSPPGRLVPSFAVAQLAVLYGLPISFNEIIVSAIVGSGVAVTR